MDTFSKKILLYILKSKYDYHQQKESLIITKKEAEISAKDQLIAELQAKLDASETAKNLAISEALEKKNQEISRGAKEHSENLMKKDAEISAAEVAQEIEEEHIERLSPFAFSKFCDILLDC